MFQHQQHISPSDEALMSDLKDGKQESLSILYERYFDKLCQFAFEILADHDISKDIVQEVFIKIMHAPEKYNEAFRFSTWAYTITGNLARNHVRDQRNRQRLGLLHMQTHVNATSRQQHQYDHHLLQGQLKHYLSLMNEKERRLYDLRFEQKKSIREIADLLNMPEGSVKSGLFYLLKKMSPLFKKQ